MTDDGEIKAATQANVIQDTTGKKGHDSYSLFGWLLRIISLCIVLYYFDEYNVWRNFDTLALTIV